VIGSLVDDLFLLARAQAGDVAVEFVLTDITEVADETLEVMKPVADKRNVKLVLTAQDRVVIETAESAVGRVLRNVVDNAVRHSPSNSTVTIAVDSDPFDTGTALVTVTDEGDGFDVEFAKRAFESFTRSDSARTREGGGAGLGLAIARALVEVLGGRIWIEPGSAGVVKMSLPATRAAG
jgi:signal transduction histidine kinase